MMTYKILLVDDDFLVLKSIRASLQDEGYEVITAENGAKAISLIEKERFDLVITDLVMDEIDGICVLKAAKHLSSDILVMILTGYGEIDYAIEAIRNEVDDYVLKVSDPEEIKYRVSNCLEKLELKRKVSEYERILPVCCVCKKIKSERNGADAAGQWVSLEQYILQKGQYPSHTYCPECYDAAMKEMDE